MKLLSFDTSFSACSVAVIETHGRADDDDDGARGTILASAYEPMVRGQASALMPMISEVMGRARVRFCDLQGIATSNGPGTFTGIRISVATARALALAGDLEVFGFSSLALLAAKANGARSSRETTGAGCEKIDGIIACVDARRDELYVQLFSGAKCAALTPPRLLKPDAAVALMQEAGLNHKTVIACGSGAEIYCAAAGRPFLPTNSGLEDLQPDAAYCSGLILKRMDPLKPLYLRAPDAKPPSGKNILRVSQ